MKASQWVNDQFSGIRAKLIGIFVLIKVVPLILLAFLAWKAMEQLGSMVAKRATGMADQMIATVNAVGDTVTEDATRALDDRSREGIERITTDAARALAGFLYDRDQDIRQAAQVEPSAAAYAAFLSAKRRRMAEHGSWKLAADGQHWEPMAPQGADPSLAADPKKALNDNAKDFSARPPEYLGRMEMRPLFAEMTYLGNDGLEQIKVTGHQSATPRLADINDRAQTFAKAETYWNDLQRLKPGEIYVSEVIGSYVGSRVIGPYTPQAAEKAGIPYAPEKSAYAGTENPVGKRFRGIVRWAIPVEKNGVRLGYVTLALDHDHIRQFTDRIVPTAARYTPIADAIVGNYAFMWDHKSRAISHPRDYFIVGYNATTGLPETPWLDQSLYEAWQASGKPSDEFLAKTPEFMDQSLKKKPAAALIKAEAVGLDCRYLNFSPQCQGWSQLTEKGGSGSFAIFFSGLWKLTTAATIPYYTGQYGKSPRGFGFITIGANVDDFHQAAVASKERIGSVIGRKDLEFKQGRHDLLATIEDSLAKTSWQLLVSTSLMILIVIAIAIKLANVMTEKITSIIFGIRRFQGGDHAYRLKVSSNDEMCELAASFNQMANEVQESFVGLSRELQTRQRAEEQLRIAASAFEAQVSIIVTDRDGVILTANQTFTKDTGYSLEDCIGQTPRLLMSGRHDETFYSSMWRTISQTGKWQGEIWDRHKNGAVHPKWLTISAVRNDEGEVTHYVGTQFDITEQKKAEERIHDLAFIDQLTGLPNRTLFLDRLNQLMVANARSGNYGALLFIDLDNFKTLNDTLGHDRGDLLLKQTAERLGLCVRNGDTVARLGGDEFVVVLADLSTNEEDAAKRAETVVNKILASLNQPCQLGEVTRPSSASIGVTLFNGDRLSIDDLMKQADLAMYRTKESGKNGWTFFDPLMESKVRDRAALEDDLRRALDQKQFMLYFQPQVLADGRVTGSEALVRWQHPQRNIVAPGDFIPLAEETGLILPLGNWVLEAACSQLAIWASDPAMAHLTVAVNVSARQFSQHDFVSQVLSIIKKTNADPNRLKLELTESLLVADLEDVIGKMSVLKSRGVGFSLDDFGTGYSSLKYLKRLPLDQLKIDQSFVRDVFTDANDAAIARTIVTLAQSLGLGVIAEGVETESQRDFLAKAGCYAYQGYLFSRPLSIQDFETFVRRA